MDIETALKAHLVGGSNGPTIVMLDIRINEEGRVVVNLGPEGFPDYVVVGDKFVMRPTKAPAQRVAATGFDAHKGMGERT